jgi:hypothetical protein
MDSKFQASLSGSYFLVDSSSWEVCHTGISLPHVGPRKKEKKKKETLN